MDYKKMFALAVATAASLQAEGYNPYSCCYSYGVNPPAVALSECAMGIDVGASYLYMQARSSHPWAYSEVFVDGLTYAESITVEPYKRDWQSGFAISLGYNMPCDMWRLGAEWMHFNASANQTFSAGFDFEQFVGDLVRPVNLDLILSQDAGDFTSGLAGDFSFRLDQVDLFLSREYMVGCYLSFTPAFGVRALYLKDETTTTWTVTEQLTTPAVVGLVVNDLKTDARAIGLAGGFGANYTLFDDFSLVGKFSAGVLYGNVDTDGKLAIGGAFFTPADSEIAITNHNREVLPQTDLYLGLMWRSSCPMWCFQGTSISFGWENHTYYGLARDIVITEKSNGDLTPSFVNANLYLSGIRASLALSF